jgi:hypothetical protein
MPLLLSQFLALYPQYRTRVRAGGRGEEFTTLFDAQTLTAFYRWVAAEAQFAAYLAEKAYAAFHQPTRSASPAPRCSDANTPIRRTSVTQQSSFTDSAVVALRQAVLDDPARDVRRLVYATLLVLRGHTGHAALINGMVMSPARTRTVPGSTAGIPFASWAAYRRGFVDTIAVGPADLHRLDGALARHPISSVRVAGTEFVLRIRRIDDSPPGGKPGWFARLESATDPGQSAGNRLTGYWPTRDEMVVGVGP